MNPLLGDLLWLNYLRVHFGAELPFFVAELSTGNLFVAELSRGGFVYSLISYIV